MITRDGGPVQLPPYELDTSEAVCPHHHTTYHAALGECPECTAEDRALYRSLPACPA